MEMALVIEIAAGGGLISDESLITRILSGEKRLYEIVVRRNNQRLFRVGMAILNQDPEVEEAMQRAYIRAYENLKKFENRSSFRTWLTRIMINECLSIRRERQKRLVGFSPEVENYPNMEMPDRGLMSKELNALLEQAIARLPQRYRLVFILREIEDMSVKETGEALGLEPSNVKIRLSRAKTMLRQHLKGYIRDHVYRFHRSRCDWMVQQVMVRIG